MTDKERIAELDEDRLVLSLCTRNGWNYGSEDYDLAVKDVKWFMKAMASLGYSRQSEPNPTVRLALKEKVAAVYWGKLRDYCPSFYWDIEWEELATPRYREDCYQFADEILNLFPSGRTLGVNPKYEPPEDKVEAVRNILKEFRQYLCNTEFAPEPFTEPVDPERIDTFAHKIYKLFPEYEPVELEELTDEEINKLNEADTETRRQHLFWEIGMLDTCKANSQATIRKNQKGQLYKVKDNS